MSRQYRNHYTHGRHIPMRFLRGDPYGYQRRVEADMKRKFDEEAAKNEAKPQKSADEIREDRQVFIGLINGVLIGGLLSGVGGYLAKWNVITICFAVFGGVVAGGLIGAMITRLIIWTNNHPKKAEAKNNNEIVSKKTNKQVTSGKTHV